MANRSQSKRLRRPSRFALLCAVLALPHAVGCQSNAQQDLIARELRMQEDQIYAMEDYLDQYQQLICKYRSENAALRRQLTDDDSPAAAREPMPASRRARDGTRSGDERLEIDRTPTPRLNGAPEPSELDVPDVPALDETTTIDPSLESQPASPDGTVASATLERTDQDSPHATHAVAYETLSSSEAIHNVWLHGEVVENDSDGGPRLVINVVPLTSTGSIALFTGRLSLMLLAPDESGGQQSLARWDYAPSDVQAAAVTTDGEHYFQFFVELPVETPVTDSTELWLRLQPQDGSKLLTHTPIDLAAPSEFSSMLVAPSPPQPIPQPPMVATALGIEPTSSASPGVYFNDAGWTIAKPNEPANLVDKNADSPNEWRASSEPLPAAHSTPARRSPTKFAPTPRKRERPQHIADVTSPPTAWTPDRPASASPRSTRAATTPARPHWSSTR